MIKFYWLFQKQKKRVNMSLPHVIWASSGLPHVKKKSLDSNPLI